MAWNGSGTFSRTNGTNTGTTVWADDRDASTKIVASNHDTHDQDLADGINNCLTKDGQNSPTANIPFGSFKITGLAAGSTSGDSVRYEQVPKLSTTNTFTGSNTFTAAGSFTVQGVAALQSTLTVTGTTTLNSQLNINSANITFTYVNAGVNGPQLVLKHDSSSPANNDVIGFIDFQSKDSAAANATHTRISSVMLDVTAGSEDSDLRLQTTNAGTLSDRVLIGQGLYTPNATGGDQGADTINCKGLKVDGTAALLDSAGSVDSTNIATDAVGQTQINGGAVHTAELDTATGTGSSTSATFVKITLSGGQYSFYPQLKTFNTSSGYGAQLFDATLGGHTAYTTVVAIHGDGTNATDIINRYVNASPPYDLGDGECGLFVYVEMNGSNVQSVYCAPDPTWAHNGPTNKQPDGYRKREDGTIYGIQKKRAIEIEIPNAYQVAMNHYDNGRFDMFDQIMDRLENDSIEEVEVDQALKNADMELFPHAFLGSTNNIIMLDPVKTHRLLSIHKYANDSGEKNINDLIHAGKIKIDNTVLNRASPKALNVHGFKM